MAVGAERVLGDAFRRHLDEFRLGGRGPGTRRGWSDGAPSRIHGTSAGSCRAGATAIFSFHDFVPTKQSDLVVIFEGVHVSIPRCEASGSRPVRRGYRELERPGVLGGPMLSLFLTALLVLALTGCGTRRADGVRGPSSPTEVDSEKRLANLERAARYPWKDDGRCAVQEASGDWATLVERCYDVLDRSRIRFVDYKGICPVAQAGTIRADELARLVGICLLVQPEVALGVVIVVGTFAVAAAIIVEIEAARARKAGCYCSCIAVNEGPYPLWRVGSPAECAALCRNHERGSMGFVCK